MRATGNNGARCSNMHTVSVVLCTSHSERKILDRKRKSAKRNILLGWRSPAASKGKSCERGELDQVQGVDAWVSCRIHPPEVSTVYHWFSSCVCPCSGVTWWVFCGAHAIRSQFSIVSCVRLFSCLLCCNLFLRAARAIVGELGRTEKHECMPCRWAEKPWRRQTPRSKTRGPLRPTFFNGARIGIPNWKPSPNRTSTGFS